jgi:hypothetical protein
LGYVLKNFGQCILILLSQFLYNIEDNERMLYMRTDILERKNDILIWIKENQSKAFICNQLHCK